MSLIIQDAGLLTIMQTVKKQTSTEQQNNEYNGAVDSLSPMLANKLVGNDVEEPTLEMSGQPGVIQFTEPTIIAYSGGDFKGQVNGEKIEPNRIYHMDRGDVLSFRESTRGSRLYLAVAGGIAVEKSNVLKSGDEVTMRRNYTALHDEIFHMMSNKRKVSWGIGIYSLVEVYLSDIYHIVKRPDVPDEVYEQLEEREYTVTQEDNRIQLSVDGQMIEFAGEDCVNPGILGGVYLNDQLPVIALNDFDAETSLTHIGTIPSYHMHKLGQKRRGSKIKFQTIDIDDAHAETYGYYLWVNSLFKAIDYKISKELVKEKM
ncbi:KipI antagonist [Jeotgalicoccus aerolatus]|uniref:Allophanate hydrolase subunit 2 n=1 Tax=Jeotgalicoccus aerolatus TaxID=709510 RepID=A0A1G8ZGV1_9STAP|nr:hypothetical protein [Jeotgalicoccus aerolatus]MBP1951127.1 allophanate hydrolase subunit 2 [Jeotgalicoccus aerolatus]NMA80606.1 hypothetical protein [Jeotgalicoccus aerolatus]CAD2077985.1 KipI antagonist [Jeotgalicoccus aerolatus]SDK13814.1 Allophanate hydrolase subunit 2 [Jeotgalicoccus aerolatus]GGE00045.1 allophanate hydrolase [Jeotgalicoccus aerolatus]